MQVKSIDNFDCMERGVKLTCENINIRIEIVEKNIIRIWSTREKDFNPEETFVLNKKEFSSFPVKIEKNSNFIKMSGEKVKVNVHLDPFWIDIYDRSGKSIVSTPEGETLEWQNQKATQRFNLPAGIQVYGLGQGTAPELNLRDCERRMWQQWDGFRYSGNAGIPFLMTSNGYGLLLNSSWASRFAIGKALPSESTSYAKPEGPWKADQHSGENHPERFAVLTEGGDMDLFVIYGPDYKTIIKGYSDLTGYPPIPPIWALGWIQCKNRYKTQNELLEIAHKYREKNIPCDVLIIDWCWFRYFGDLDWVAKYWPDPWGMVHHLKSMGFHIMQAQHPYMHTQAKNFNDFNSRGYLISWDPSRVPDKWPPDGIKHAVDFSNPGARKLWWEKIEPLFRQGIDGYWTDMGELETHPPGCSSHYLGPREKVHNIYSTLWNMALYEGQRSISNRRVFCLSRTAYAGIQRYGSALWSGDIDPTWEVLDHQVVIGQQVCMSGQPFWTTDIGGFMTADFYEPELYVRWFQWGTFCPIFRTHGTRPENETWSFGSDIEKILVDYIKIRYRLMPYIYSCVYETHKTGVSIMRAMLMEFPQDSTAARQDHQFMFGPSILVAPVTEKGKRCKKVWLPEGIWYNYWENKKYEGPQEVDEIAPLWKIPIYIRGGSIIPEGPDVLHTGNNLFDPLTIHIYPGKDAQFTLYEDDGKTYDYEEGVFSLTGFVYNEKLKSLKIQSPEVTYPGLPVYRNFRLIYHHTDCPEKIKVNGKILNTSFWKYDSASGKLEVELNNIPVKEDILLEMEGNVLKNYPYQPENKPSLFSGYDLEVVYSPFRYIMRVYLDNRAGKNPVQGKLFVQMPPGWSYTPVDGKNFNAPQDEISISKIELIPDGDSFTQTSTMVFTIYLPHEEQTINIQLGSGWISWWKVAGPYKMDNLHGFNKVFLPEKTGCVSEKSLENGIRAVNYKGFECFGYVNLEKIFNPKDITQMVATTTEYKVCYASCVVDSPDKKICIMQLMGEDRFKVWINNHLVAIVHDCVARPVEYLVQLEKGKNHILIKCTQDAHREWNDRSWGFYLRFTDDERKPLNDILVSAEF